MDLERLSYLSSYTYASISAYLVNVYYSAFDFFLYYFVCFLDLIRSISTFVSLFTLHQISLGSIWLEEWKNERIENWEMIEN